MAHAFENLDLARGEGGRRAHLGRAQPARGQPPGRVGERLGHGGTQLRTRGVLVEVPACARGHGERHTVQVLGDGEHDDARTGVGGQQPPDGLDTAETRHAYVHQNQVRTIGAPTAEDFLTVGRRRHTLDARHGRDRATERLSGKRGVVADEDGCHGRPPQLMRVTLCLQAGTKSSPVRSTVSDACPSPCVFNRLRTLNDGHSKELRGSVPSSALYVRGRTRCRHARPVLEFSSQPVPHSADFLPVSRCLELDSQ